MPKNYNLVTKKVSLRGTVGTAVAFGSSVAANMTRYVTMVRVIQNAVNPTGKGTKVWICSAAATSSAATSSLASATKKMAVRIPSAIGSNKVFQAPLYPDSENPLFSIAAGKFLTAKITSAAAGSASCTVFVQYYDQ